MSKERMSEQKAGKTEILVRAMEVSAPMLMTAALLATRHREDAEDAVQQTYLKAWRGIEGFREESQINTWLYRILQNTIKDARDRAHSRREVQLDLPLDLQTDTDPEIDPEAHLLRQEAYEQMLEDIKQLPEHQQAETLLFAYGFSIKEIAEILGKPKGTIKCYLSRARDRIRQTKLDEAA